jgi:glycosyltransferase involved in cell wall biosynthesis
VRNFKIQDKVKFIGSVKYAQVTKYYQASDLIISVSSRDASPQSVIESLSCEIPVIVGDIPPLREIIIDNHNGFIVPCRNPQLLASKILYIKTNPEAISVIVENGRKTVIQKYDYNSNMHTMHELFKKL